MFKTASVLALGMGLAVATLQPAGADSYYYGTYGWRFGGGDIGRDIDRVRRDREQVRIDEARVAKERADVEAARARERDALRRGDIIGVVRSYEQEQKEVRELAAAQRKLDVDRERLQHDRRVLHRDIEQRRRWWWWG